MAFGKEFLAHDVLLGLHNCMGTYLVKEPASKGQQDSAVEH